MLSKMMYYLSEYVDEKRPALHRILKDWIYQSIEDLQ